jgi:hypothetical protein
MMTEMTYGRMEEILQSLGFTFRGVEEENKVFLHPATGALVIFPEFPPESPVLPRHLLSVKGILTAYGIAEPTAFTAELQKAS